MKVNCNVSETVSGLKSLIDTLEYYYNRNPKVSVKVYSDMIADRHDITVSWQEER